MAKRQRPAVTSRVHCLNRRRGERKVNPNISREAAMNCPPYAVTLSCIPRLVSPAAGWPRETDVEGKLHPKDEDATQENTTDPLNPLIGMSFTIPVQVSPCLTVMVVTVKSKSVNKTV